jgi:hypothetical protein
MSLRRKTKYFLQKMHTLARTRLKSLSIAAFMVFLAVFAVQYTEPSRPTAAFVPESIGLGQGVAACFSGTPTITCNSAGQYVLTVSIEDPPDSLNIQGFRVILVTNLNDPEHSVKAEINNISSSGGTYSTTFTGSAGTQYWPIELRYADGWWTYSDVGDVITGPTCVMPTAGVQGYKVNSARQAGFAEQTITVQGGNQPPSSGTNPYSINGLTPGGYNVTSSVPSNHSVSYCVGGGCSYYTLGNSVNVTAPSGSAVDLWWQYSPWTTYCTTGDDPNNPWEWWRHDAVADPNTHYEFVRDGDGVCTPPKPGQIIGTISVSPPGSCTVAPGATTCAATVSWSTQNAQQSVAQGAGPLWPNGADIDGPTTNSSGSVVKNLPVGDYIFSVSAHAGISWGTPLDSVTYKVVAGNPDLTVSGVTPTSAIVGKPTTFSATVTNTGSGSTNIGFKNFYQIKSNDTAYTPQNFFTKLFNIARAAEIIIDLPYSSMNALAAGGSGTATQTHTFSKAGEYGVRVCADKANNADEFGVVDEGPNHAGEYNNCGGWTNVNVVGACTPGASCSASNACYYAQGTYDANCNCSATVPPVPPTYGDSCTSGPNVCGKSNSGTIMCNGSCSASTPSDSLCLPTVELSADTMRVRKDTSTKLTWSSTDATSCSLVGQNGFTSSDLSGTAVDSGPLDAQTKFTLTCSNTYSPPSVSESVIVNLLPSYIEQ